MGLAALAPAAGTSPSGDSDRGAGGRTYDFHGMSVAGSARMVERIQSRNQMIAGVSVDPGIYAQPAEPHDDIDPGIIAPGEPDISHRNPDEPNDALYRTGPDPGTEQPGSGGAGDVPYYGGDSGQGGAGGGGNSQSGPDDAPGTTEPAPRRNSIENPPGRKLMWNNDEPYWDDGTPVDIWRTYENGQERVHYGYPVPIPGSQDDAYPVPAPSTERSVPQPGTTPDPARGDSPSDQPSSPLGTESSPTQENEDIPNGPHNDEAVPVPAAGTQPGEGGGFSPLPPPPNVPPLRVPPPPELNPETTSEPANEEQALLEEFLRWLSEYISTDPGFLESLIPIWGPLRQAISDGLAGDWTGFAANIGLLILDVTGIGALGRIGAKILAKPFKSAVPGLFESIGRGLQGVGREIRDLADRLPWSRNRREAAEQARRDTEAPEAGAPHRTETEPSAPVPHEAETPEELAKGVDPEALVLSGVNQKHLRELKPDGRPSRPYLTSTQIIKEIMENGTLRIDPGGYPGAVRWDAPGSLNGKEGNYELVIDTKRNVILHFLWKPRRK